MFHACTKHIQVHYHFVRDRVLSGEVEHRYVRTDRQVADIFTKALGSDKLQNFSEILCVQRLDVPHLRVRTETCTGTEEVAREKKNETREDKEKKGVESIEEVNTSDRVRTSGNNSKVEKDRADRKKEAKTRTWSDVVKGLEIED